jgi:hypothetical protein
VFGSLAAQIDLAGCPITARHQTAGCGRGRQLFAGAENGGKGEVKRANEFLIFHYPTGSWPAMTALIEGDQKLVYGWAHDRGQLFDLGSDIGE